MLQESSSSSESGQEETNAEAALDPGRDYALTGGRPPDGLASEWYRTLTEFASCCFRLGGGPAKAASPRLRVRPANSRELTPNRLAEFQALYPEQYLAAEILGNLNDKVRLLALHGHIVMWGGLLTDFRRGGLTGPGQSVEAALGDSPVAERLGSLEGGGAPPPSRRSQRNRQVVSNPFRPVPPISDCISILTPLIGDLQTVEGTDHIQVALVKHVLVPLLSVSGVTRLICAIRWCQRTILTAGRQTETVLTSLGRDLILSDLIALQEKPLSDEWRVRHPSNFKNFLDNLRELQGLKVLRALSIKGFDDIVSDWQHFTNWRSSRYPLAAARQYGSGDGKDPNGGIEVSGRFGSRLDGLQVVGE